MWYGLVVMILLGWVGADSLETFQPQADLRTHRSSTRVSPLGTTYSLQGNSVASTTITLRRWSSGVPANAEFMSLGPPGPAIPDTLLGPFHQEGTKSRRLRVTLCRSETVTGMLVDVIET